MKKFVFLSLTVLLGVSLFLAGCGDPETGPAGTSGSGGRIGDGHVSGTPSIAGLQAMIDRYDGTGAELVLDNITLAGPGTVDLKGVKAHFVGTATLSNGVVINAVSATVGFADGAKIAGTSSDTIIGKSTVFTSANVTGGALVAAPVSGADDFDEVIGGVTAVETLTLTSAGPVIPSNLKVYVFGTLTVNGDAAAPSNSGAKVIAIGNVTLKPNTQANTAVLADASKVDVSGAAITLEPAESGAATAEYTLPATFAGREIYVSGENDVLTLSTVTSIDAYLRGNGLVKLSAAVTSVNITGSGRVQFTGTIPTLADGSSITTGSTGYAQFDNGFKSPSTGAVTLSGNVIIPATKTIETVGTGTVTLKAGTKVSTATGSTPATLTAASDLTLTPASNSSVLTVKAGGEVDVSGAKVTFTGDVVFGGNLTLTQAPADFKGTAWFAATKKITFTHGDSIITLVNANNGALAVGTPSLMPTVYSYVLSTDSADVTLTPAADTTLTFAAAGVTQGGGATHQITVGGTAVLRAGATYTVASANGAVGTLVVDTSATLELAAGFLASGGEVLPGADGYDATKAELVLTGATSADGATLKGAGKVIAGGTEIVGGTNGWQVVNSAGTDTVTLKEDAIAGATTAVFTATTGTDSVITVPEAKTFTIEANTTIDLKGDNSAEVAGILLKGATSGTNGGTLAFAQGTTSVVKTANTGSTASNKPITNATVGTGLTVLKSSNNTLVSITSKDVDDGRTIKAGTEGEDVTLNGVTVAGQ